MAEPDKQDKIYKLGPDGEPVPVGNVAQASISALIASTYNKEAKRKFEEKKDAYIQELKKEQPVPEVKKPELSPDELKEVQKKQNEFNKVEKELTHPGVNVNKTVVSDVKLEGEGVVVNPQ